MGVERGGHQLVFNAKPTEFWSFERRLYPEISTMNKVYSFLSIAHDHNSHSGLTLVLYNG